jgi:hypothetical protein
MPHSVITHKKFFTVMVAGLGLLLPIVSVAETLGDTPAFPLVTHVDQFQIANGAVSFVDLFNEGDRMFETSFNNLDGVGANLKQDASVSLRFSRVPRADLPGFTSDPFRATGPNARACNACHSGPTLPGRAAEDDGSGDTVANAQRDPLRTRIPSLFIQRNTPHLYGAGALQNLAQEMTAELIAIRDSAVSAATACSFSCTVTKNLAAKGITFGTISATKTVTFFFGSYVSTSTSGVKGITQDLIVRPFEWKGSVAFLRDFVRGASLNELGMQPVEMVGENIDQDKDGVINELSVGDITALTVYNAAQPRPVTLKELNALDPAAFPLTSAQLAAINAGESSFTATCSGCHTTSLTMNNPVFSEPSTSAYYRDVNFPSGANPVNLGLSLAKPVTFSFLTDLAVPFEAALNGGAIVRLYSDLKWHDMGAGLAESIDEAGNGASVFITKALWGVGSTAPYLHDGRAPTLSAAILAHGGEAQSARNAFAAMSATNQNNLVEFLKNLVLYKP